MSIDQLKKDFESRAPEFYQALLNKDASYEGVFFVGVTSTGIFCRPTCPARKPKFAHCAFYPMAEQALLAGYRPCKRCQPLSHPNHTSPVIQQLVQAVEENPQRKWKTADFRALSIDESTARRQFKKRFGMTFVQYARARRLGLAFQGIRQGSKVIEAQLEAGYESSSGFCDAFTKFMGAPPVQAGKYVRQLSAHWLDTPLGPMVAIADDDYLYLVEFIERRGLEKEIERLRQRLKASIVPGITDPIQLIEQELMAYFNGTLKDFKTPIKLLGSSFQQQVWEALMAIPYGETRSYQAQAKLMGKPTATRAVANGNGMNQLAIIVPCHRVITSSGDLGGYGGGIHRKQWLLDHEKKATALKTSLA